MILKPLGQNYLKSSLGQPIQRKTLGRSLVPLGSSQLPSIRDLEEREKMREFSYSPWDEWGATSREKSSIPSLQTRQDNSLSTPRSLEENIVLKNNISSENIAPEVQRSLLDSSSFSTLQATQNMVSDGNGSPEITIPEVQRSPVDFSPQTIDENIISESNNITETTTPEVQRSPLESLSLSVSQTSEENIVSNRNNISGIETPEVRRSPEDRPLSELPGYQDTYSENNIQSHPNFSLSQFTANAIDNTFPIARKVIQRVNEIVSPQSSNFSSSESVQSQNESLETEKQNIQRSPLESSSLSTPQTTEADIVSDNTNIVETTTPEVQRSPEDKPLSELPGYGDVYSEDNVQSRPKFSLSDFASNAIENTLPIARKVIQRVNEIASPKSSNLASSEMVQPKKESLSMESPEIQRSPLEPSSLSTPQARSENIVANSSNSLEIQRSPLESPSPSTPQERSENIVANSSNSLEIQRSLLKSSSLSTPQERSENIVANRNNITETPTSEVQRSPSNIPPSLSQPDAAIATEESQVTTLSEGQGFLQLQPLGQPQPLGKNSDYYPSSFVSTSLKEILSYSGDKNSSPVQKKENTGNTIETSVSTAKTLDFPQSWSNVSELIGNSSNPIDMEKTEDWGGFSGLMEDTRLLPESIPTPASEAIVQAKNAPVEGELLTPIAFEEISQEEPPALPPTPQLQKQELEQPIADEELDLLAQLVYRLVRSRLNIEREQQYNQLGGASLWPDAIYFARDENSPLASSEMFAMRETLSPYSSDRLSILAREVYVLLQMRLECDRDRQGICS
ncbi:MAG: hypothetical protein J7647_26865 [Cyanobacteria bacterium SBLK]|nr:hypothetical protein [Cyanobacteria bacterium SBLK]